MTTYGWQNEDGEPIMDGAAYRFEQELDAQYAEERAMERYDDWYADEEPDWFPCDVCGEDNSVDPADGICVDCGAGPDDEPVLNDYPMEDEWLDGSYEE